MKTASVVGQLLFCLMIVTSLSSVALGDVVGVFYDSAIPQSDFAASEIKIALEGKHHSAELKPLSELSADYPNQKIVLSLASHGASSQVLILQGNSTIGGLGEQAYAIRTTSKSSQKSYWVLGGDANGIMYGGLQLAENIRFNDLGETYNSQEDPYVNPRVTM